MKQVSRKLFASFAIVLLPALMALGGFTSAPQKAAADTNYNNLISDAVFDNANTMTAAQIDAFLNAFPNSCISSNNGFSSPDVVGYNPSQGFLYGSNVTAGRVIYDAAQAYQINPQVLLATLQKEQSLVSGSAGCYPNEPNPSWPFSGTPANGKTFTCSINGGSTTCTYACTHAGGCINIALGYNCPGYCKTSSEGFSKQIIGAAWLLKFDRMRSEGNVTWAIIKSGWDNSDDLGTTYAGYMTQGTFQRCSSCSAQPYDGYGTLGDGSSVHMDNGATAALYDYTPFKSGNNSFVTIFTSWFGSPYYPFAADVTVNTYSDAAHTQSLALTSPIASGQKIYVAVSAVNTGNQAWSNTFTHIGTSSPNDRSSIFRDNSWPSSNRAAILDETSVAPGGTGTFSFSMTTPATDGVYNEAFQLVADGQAGGWMMGNASFTLSITVSNPYNGVLTSLKTFRDSGYTQPTDPGEMAAGQTMYVRATVRNTGANTWSPSTTRVGTANPADSTSPFQDTSWISASRPAAVTTSVVSGQTGTFQFAMAAPSTTGDYTETFGFVDDSSGEAWMPSPGFSFSTKIVTSPMDTLYANIQLYPGQQLESQNGQYVAVMQNDGNLVIYCSKGAIWGSGTNGQSVGSLIMQGDGNLVMYAPNGKGIWDTKTNGDGAAKLVMQNDGNLVVWAMSGRVLWQTGTYINVGNTPSVLQIGQTLHNGQALVSPDGRYHLIMQGDGNLVVYSPRRALWGSGTNDKGGAFVAMQGDGNVAVYTANGHALWGAGTQGTQGALLVMQNDGNLVIYTANGHALWGSGTQGQI